MAEAQKKKVLSVCPLNVESRIEFIQIMYISQ